MNYVIIFAGGSGSRMHGKYGNIPKQYIEINGKTIIEYTLEKFCNSKYIDGIILVVKNDYIEYTKNIINGAKLSKIINIVPGGETGQQSIFNGVKALSKIAKNNDVVLIHDGVRPIIDDDLIKLNIKEARKNHCVVSCVKAIETIIVRKDNKIKLIDRQNALYARAPQTMHFGDLIKMHKKAIASSKFDYIDTCSMAIDYGYNIKTVNCLPNNIKITTPIDVEMFRGLINE